MLLAAPQPASLEVVCDASGFIANFWRATKHQPGAVAEAADYPVSHIDLGARHIWLMEQRERIGALLQDPNWPGDAKVAGWWLWGQCSWIGAGWCEWEKPGQIPQVSNAVQAIGQIPHISNAGMGIQAIGQIPHLSNAGVGIDFDTLITSSGRTAWVWLHKLANRLERVRILHGDWKRCLNNTYGGTNTAVFLDPPYSLYEGVYGEYSSMAGVVADWARENAHLRIALCGLVGDYDLPAWDVVKWTRGRFTYSGQNTTDKECIWYSPACLNQISIFSLGS